MFSLPLLADKIRLRRAVSGNTQVFDPIRKRWVAYTPEEAVRQNFIACGLSMMHYPQAYFSVEKGVSAPGIAARFDLIVFDKAHHPWMLVECKAPDVPISEATLFQLLRYHQKLRCRYWVLYNGVSCYCADARFPEKIAWLPALPPFEDLVGGSV